MPRNRLSGRSSGETQGHFSGRDGQISLPPGRNIREIGDISRRMLAKLSSTIETDIIPRLMLAFDSTPAAEAQSPAINNQLSDNVEEFVHLLLKHDAGVATNYVSTLRSDGFPLPALYLDLLSPAARRLGEMWEEDECTFTDVTIGVCRMHQVLLEFSRCFDADIGVSEPGNTALIVPTPGEQHTFGLFMVMEFLRRAGWNCWSGAPSSDRELLNLVGSYQFDVVGLSLSGDLFVSNTKRLIEQIRQRSSNAELVVLVGGRIVNENPILVAELGADAMARDGQDAVEQVNRLCPASRSLGT